MYVFSSFILQGVLCVHTMNCFGVSSSMVKWPVSVYQLNWQVHRVVILLITSFGSLKPTSVRLVYPHPIISIIVN